MNHDGSGKLDAEIGLGEQIIPFLQNFQQTPTSHDEIESTLVKGIRKLMESVEGVDAWSNMRLVHRDEMFSLSMTAHFPDINKVRMRMHGRTLIIGGSTNKDQQWKLNLQFDEAPGSPANKSAETSKQQPQNPAPASSDEDVEQMLTMADSITPLLPMIASQLPEKAGSYEEVVVGGKILDAQSFAHVEANRAWNRTSAKEMLNAMAALLADKEIARSIFAEAKTTGAFNIEKLPAPLQEKIRSIIEKAFPNYKDGKYIFIAPGNPAFDYKSELSVAKKNPGPILRLVRRANLEGQVTEHAFLGVALEDSPSNLVRVTKVAPNSPAKKSELETGDIILKIDGYPVKKASEMTWLVRTSEIGSTITLALDRGGQILEKKVMLGSTAK